MDRITSHTPWRRVSAGLLAAGLALLAACGGGGDGGTGSGGGGDGGATTLTPYTLAGSGPAIDVAVELDSARAVAQDVPVGGGALSVTGVDGSRYTLVVPDDALLQDTRITLTPVVQVSGLPLGETGRTALGVQMEPSGLNFMNAATLVVEPAAAAAVPLERQLFVQWDGDGRKLAFAAPEPTQEIRLKVLHFSGMGVVRSKGLDADIEAVRQRIGGDAERRIQSAVAEKLMRERQRQLLGVADEEIGRLVDLVGDALSTQYDAEVLRPRIAAAGTSCAAGRLALQTVIGLSRQLQLLGAGNEDPYDPEITGLIPTVAEVCMREEFEICRDEHVLTRILPARIGLERQAQLFGYPEGTFDSTDRYVQGCLKFELDFLSTAGGTTEQFDFDEGVQALRVRLQLDGPNLQGGNITGSTALQSMYYDVRRSARETCRTPVNLTRIGSTFTVQRLRFVASGEDVADFQLDFSPGRTQSSFRVRDCSDPPQTSPLAVELNHGTSYGPVRVATAPTPPEALLVKEWTVQRGEVLARKTERVTFQVDAGTQLYYDDRWELRHTPGL